MKKLSKRWLELFESTSVGQNFGRTSVGGEAIKNLTKSPEILEIVHYNCRGTATLRFCWEACFCYAHELIFVCLSVCFDEKVKIILKREKHFSNWFLFKWKSENQFKKWKNTFQTDFHLLKKGEIMKNHLSNWFSF